MSSKITTVWTVCHLMVLVSLKCKSTTALTADCFHDEYKERKGTITSPNYPQVYPNNICERWYVEAQKGEIITLSIKEMDIEVGDDNSCNRDYVEIGPSPAKKLCGANRKPFVYISDGPHVVIEFKSDRYTNSKGFLLHYISGPVQAPHCEQDEFRCNNGKCIYRDWKCNGADECGDNSDETRCPTGTTPPILSCGDDLLCQSVANSQHICVDKDRICDGKQDCLNKEDEASCGNDQCQAHIHDLTGTIHSPLYPKDYPINRDCLWTLHMRDMKDKIQVHFVDFNIQSNKDTDYVEVYDGKDLDTSSLIGRYYGGLKPPKLIESKGNWMKIKFHSDGSFGEKGFNLTFQRKGTCLPSQLPCGLGENDCFDRSKHCDGLWDCPHHGGDEISCGCLNLYRCGKSSSQCYDERHRCNGVGHCTNMADELNCTPMQCGTHNGTFLCDNKKCIYETWKCDKTDDCGDGSDERGCGKSTNLIIIAAVAGALICSLLLVVALGCTCKLYNLRMHQLNGPQQETPLSRLYAEFMRRRAPPPYHEAMLTSRSYEEVRREYLEQLNQSDQTGEQSQRRRSNRRSSRGHQQNRRENSGQSSSGTNSQDRDGNERDRRTDSHVTQNSTNGTSNLERHSSTTALLQNDSDSNDSSESELESPSRDRVRVHFSDETGISAQYRRNSQNNRNKDANSSASSSIPHSSSVPAGDTASLETATIASCDSVDISKIENTNPSSTKEPSHPLMSDQSSTLIRNPVVDVRSRESLDSVGSENIMADCPSVET